MRFQFKERDNEGKKIKKERKGLKQRKKGKERKILSPYSRAYSA